MPLFRSSALDFQRFGSCRLRRRQPSCQHAEWRTRNIVQSSAIAELHRRGLSAVFAADSHFQIRTRLAPAFGRHFHELADTILIENGKWIMLDDSIFKIRRENLVDVVAREAPSSLREIVGTKGEEFRLVGDLTGD